MNQSKYAYLLKVRETASRLAQVLKDSQELAAVWDDRLYGPGAANEITALDLAPLDPYLAQVPPDDLYAFMIAVSQINRFIEGDSGAVAGPYSATLNKLRQDV